MQRLRFGHFACGLAALAISACGSRSQLSSLDAGSIGGGGAGGSGSGGDTGGGGSTGGGGTGGSGGNTTTVPPGPCPELGYATPFAALPGGSSVHQRSPGLAFSSSDGSSVTVATTWQVVEGPGPTLPIELRHTTFAPWGIFPVGSGLAPTYLADLDGGVSYAIAPSSGDQFALLFASDFFGPGGNGGLRFSSEFAAKSGVVPSTQMVGNPKDRALFLTRGPKSFAFGAAADNGGKHEITMGLVNDDLFLGDFALGCSAQPTFADAVAIGDTFLVFFGSDPSFVGTGCDGVVPNPPTTLLVARVVNGSLMDIKEVVQESVTDVRVAPRSDGAWLVWTTAGGADVPPATHIGRVDPLGALVAPPLDWPLFGDPGSMAVASFEDFLMLGAIEPEPEGASPLVQVFAPDGDVRAGMKIAATGAAKGRLSLLGSPFGRSVVAAWSETVGGEDKGDQVRVTRVDCIE